MSLAETSYINKSYHTILTATSKTWTRTWTRTLDPDSGPWTLTLVSGTGPWTWTLKNLE